MTQANMKNKMDLETSTNYCKKRQKMTAPIKFFIGKQVSMVRFATKSNSVNIQEITFKGQRIPVLV